MNSKIVKLLQFLKVFVSIRVTYPETFVIVVNALQFSNALYPIKLAESESAIVCNCLFPAKAYGGIVFAANRVSKLPALPLKVAICVFLISSFFNKGILSLKHTKSRASIVPDTVRLEMVSFCVFDKLVPKLPAWVIVTV